MAPRSGMSRSAVSAVDDGEAQALAGDERAEAGEALGGVRVRLLLGGEETKPPNPGRGGRFGEGARGAGGGGGPSARARELRRGHRESGRGGGGRKGGRGGGDPATRGARRRRCDARRERDDTIGGGTIRGRAKNDRPRRSRRSAPARPWLTYPAPPAARRGGAGPTDARGGRTAPGDDARGTNHARIRETREVCVTRPSEPVGRSGDVSREAGAR